MVEITKDYLLTEYIVKRKTTREIGKNLNLCHVTILNYLKKYEIKPRDRGEAQIGKKISKEAKQKMRLSKLGKKQTEEQKQNTSRIMKAYFKLHPEQFKIGNYSGSNHPNWLGGVSKSGYSFKFNRKLKLSIRTRDNFKCQQCSKLQIDCNRKLDVHHIDYDKMNNNEENLISLCKSCHMKTGFNRTYWTKYFQELSKEKYEKENKTTCICR